MKDDLKAKVGRPKLADDSAVKKAKISIAISFFLCFVLLFSFISILNNQSPIEYSYKIIRNKLNAMNSNPKGFIEKSYYDSNHDYIMEIKITESVDKFSGSYRYTTYYLGNNGWKKDKTIDVKKGTRNIKIKLDSKKNENVTWKIKFQIVNGAEVKESYAPFSWKFVDAKDTADKYVYKVFTVKGYYSPVSINEIKEANKKKDTINVYTTKEEPRNMNINLPDGTYNITIKYTDVNGKQMLLSSDKNVTKKISYKIPNIEKSTKVTIMIWNNNANLEKKILSNWKLKKDKNNNSYATNYYVVKPEKSYEY